MKTIRI